MKISLGGITDNKHNKYFRIEGRLAIMNISKFTQKSVEAVQNCEKLAYEYGNQQIDQEHLLVSLLKLDDSLILKLITKMGISGEQFADEAEAALKKLPKVSGGGQVYLTQDLTCQRLDLQAFPVVSHVLQVINLSYQEPAVMHYVSYFETFHAVYENIYAAVRQVYLL